MICITLNTKMMDDLYSFLSDNYLGNDQCRVVYPKELLKNLLFVPGHDKKLFLVLMEHERIIGFVSAIPMTLNIDSVCYLNFLCVHKEYRHKNLAPVLINSISTECKNLGYSLAFYTSGKNHNRPIFCQKRYFHREINTQKLINAGYTRKDSLCIAVTHPDFLWKSLTKEDLPNLKFPQTRIYQKYSIEELEHYFLNTTRSFVVKKYNGEITNFVSFSVVDLKMNNEVIKQAYIYKHYGEKSIENSVYLAHKILYCDVLNVLEQENFILHGFKKGTGCLNYLFYNYNTDLMTANDVDIGII